MFQNQNLVSFAAKIYYCWYDSWAIIEYFYCIWNPGLEENEEPDNVEDDEEGNDSEEEWEEELDLVIIIYVFIFYAFLRRLYWQWLLNRIVFNLFCWLV